MHRYIFYIILLVVPPSVLPVPIEKLLLYYRLNIEVVFCAGTNSFKETIPRLRLNNYTHQARL